MDDAVGVGVAVEVDIHVPQAATVAHLVDHKVAEAGQLEVGVGDETLGCHRHILAAQWSVLMTFRAAVRHEESSVSEIGSVE